MSIFSGKAFCDWRNSYISNSNDSYVALRITQKDTICYIIIIIHYLTPKFKQFATLNRHFEIPGKDDVRTLRSQFAFLH